MFHMFFVGFWNRHQDLDDTVRLFFFHDLLGHSGFTVSYLDYLTGGPGRGGQIGEVTDYYYLDGDGVPCLLAHAKGDTTIMDLDGDGIVEIPTQPDEAGLLNLSQSRRMDFIVWMDYTSSHPEKSFGLLDEETNCYIELPAEWEGNLKLTDSEEFDGAVELRTVDEDQLVLTVRLARTSANSTGWTRLGVVASRQVQARMGPDVLLSDTNYRLSKALYLLN